MGDVPLGCLLMFVDRHWAQDQSERHHSCISVCVQGRTLRNEYQAPHKSQDATFEALKFTVLNIESANGKAPSATHESWDVHVGKKILVYTISASFSLEF